jgi:hypothetical protein
MELSNQSWNLTLGQEYPISFRVDGGRIATVTAMVRAPKIIAIELASNSDLFRLFREGHTLEIGAAGGSFAFNLDESTRALDMTLQCAKYYSANVWPQSNPSNPFASPGQTNYSPQLNATNPFATPAPAISPELKV